MLPGRERTLPFLTIFAYFRDTTAGTVLAFVAAHLKLQHMKYYFSISRTRQWAFAAVGLLAALMAAGSAAGQLCGTDWAIRYWFASPWTAILATMAAGGATLLTATHWRRDPWTAGLHAALLLIIAGGIASGLAGTQGKIELRTGGAPTDAFQTGQGRVKHLPFRLSLLEANTVNSPYGSSVQDFAVQVNVQDEDGNIQPGFLAMNRPLRREGWRLCLLAIGPEKAQLTVTHDPWGTGLVYSGFGLLIVCFAGYFLQRGGRFRTLLRDAGHRGTMLLAGILTCGTLWAADAPPRTLQQGLAKSFGRLYVDYNGRVCPVQTLAQDFCRKLCGATSYRGLTAEQVLTGWIFYYDDWKDEPMIRIRGGEARRLLGSPNGQAALTDFYGPEGYKLAEALESGDRGVLAADEKCRLVSWVCTGTICRIYPYRSHQGKGLTWLSWTDPRPADMPLDDWKFIVGSMEYVARQIHTGHNVRANEALLKIRLRQQAEAGPENLPSETRFEAERLYNTTSHTGYATWTAILCGLLSLVVYSRSLILRRAVRRGAGRTFCTVGILLWLYISFILCLRGYVSGHWPLANGFETMQFMSWCSLSAGLLLWRRFRLALPFGLIVCGLCLAVATLGEQDPAITPLLPVLGSPLLSLHVVTIMLSYALLAFTWMGSLTALVASGAKHVRPERRKELLEELRRLVWLLLVPATFFLAVGICIGAVWAGESWGRYWGWDPKEVWALITLLVYVFPLHDASLKFFRRPQVFHWYMVFAFLSVLFTYFGVNFFLPGLHSYAV